MSIESKNKQGFNTFFSERYNELRIYVRHQIDDAADRDAEDIIQDTALNIFNKIDFSNPIDDIAAYVYQSLRNKIRDIFRRRTFKAVREEAEYEVYFEAMLHEFAETVFGSADNSYPESYVADLQKALAELKPEYQAVIAAVDFQGYSYKEYSEQTGIPLGTLLSYRHRALSELNKKLNHLKSEL